MAQMRGADMDVSYMEALVGVSRIKQVVTVEDFMLYCLEYRVGEFADIFEAFKVDIFGLSNMLIDICGQVVPKFDLMKDLANTPTKFGVERIQTDIELTGVLESARHLAKICRHSDSISAIDFLKAFYFCHTDMVKYIELAGISDYVTFIAELDRNVGFVSCMEVISSFADSCEKTDLNLLLDTFKSLYEAFVSANGFDQLNREIYGNDYNNPERSSNKEVVACTDLLELAKHHEEPLVGREKEIDKTVRILCRKEKHNVMHLGEAGVGKTAVALGLAKAIVNGQVPEKLKGCKFYSLDVGSLMAGTRYRGDLEEKIIAMLKQLDAMGNAILYIDEIHMLMGGDGSGSMNMAQQIKKALLESSIRFIGATTFSEYRKFIEKDSAFARRFKTVDIVEPTPSEAKKIIKGVISYYEEYHGVDYDADAVDGAVDLTVKYVHDKYLPDKALDIIDEAGAQLSKDDNHGVVTRELVEKIVSENYNIPKETVTEDDNKVIFSLEDKLKSVVYGQDEAIKECVNAIKLSRAGLAGENKPVASLLFVGQTGVGKTEIARQLAKMLHIDFLKYDMSEYMDATSVNKLIGSSAGYVGYDDGGRLVEDIRKHPYSVLLLDEIEKAHPMVFNTLLQVMDDAKLTDNKGRIADFKNVIIIMTSNAGASGVKVGGLGFGNEVSYDYSQMSKAVEKTFTPEFRSRLTKVVVLNSMNNSMAEKIVKKELGTLKAVINKQGVDLYYTPSVVKYCVKHGITKEYGARPIINLINRDIKMLLADRLLQKEHSSIKLTIKNDKVVVNNMEG